MPRQAIDHSGYSHLAPPLGNVNVSVPRTKRHGTLKLSAQELNEVTQGADTMMCPICMDTFFEPVVTECLHRFCKECIQRHFRHYDEKKSEHKCPLCNVEIRSVRSIKTDQRLAALIMQLCPNRQRGGEGVDSDAANQNQIMAARELHDQKVADMRERSAAMDIPRVRYQQPQSNYSYTHQEATSRQGRGRGRPRSADKQAQQAQALALAAQAQAQARAQAQTQAQAQSKRMMAAQQMQQMEQQRLQKQYVQQYQQPPLPPQQHTQNARQATETAASIDAKNKAALARVPVFLGEGMWRRDIPQQRTDLLMAVEGVGFSLLRHPRESSMGVFARSELRASADTTVDRLKRFLYQQDEVNCPTGMGKVLDRKDRMLLEVALVLQHQNLQPSSGGAQAELVTFALANDSTTLLQIQHWASKKFAAARVAPSPLRIYYSQR